MHFIHCDCASCPLWSPSDESCTASEMLEYDPDGFFEICPDCKGASDG